MIKEKMTDISYTQTSRAMSSKPLSRGNVKSKSVMQLANEQSKAKAKVIRRSSGDDSIFMGC